MNWETKYGNETVLKHRFYNLLKTKYSKPFDSANDIIFIF